MAATAAGAFHQGREGKASSQHRSATPSVTMPKALLRATDAAMTPAKIFHLAPLVVSAREKQMTATGSRARAAVWGDSP